MQLEGSPAQSTTPTKDTLVRSIVWVFLLRVSGRGIGFARTVVLAHLLSPHDFGVFGIALIAINAIDQFSATGIEHALIAEKNLDRNALNAGWTLQLLRGLLVSGVLFLSAPSIASFLNETQAVGIIQIAALVLALNGFTNTGTVYFQKHLRFQRQYVLQTIPTLFDLVAAIIAAVVFRSALALVVGLLFKSLVQVGLSYLMSDYRPRLNLNLSQSKRLLHFGKWVWIDSAVIFLATQGDDILLAKLFDAQTLGLYLMAYRLATVFSSELTGILAKVAFPSYSLIQSSPQDLGALYLGFVRHTVFATLPISAILLALSSGFVEVVLGTKWLAMVPAFKILIIGGALNSISGTAGSLFMGIGQPKHDSYMNSLRLIAMAIPIYPLAMHYQMVGIAIASLAGVVATVIYWLLFSARLTTNSLGVYLRTLALPISGSVVSGLAVSSLYGMWAASTLAALITCAAVGIAVYLLVFVLVDRQRIFLPFLASRER